MNFFEKIFNSILISWQDPFWKMLCFIIIVSLFAIGNYSIWPIPLLISSVLLILTKTFDVYRKVNSFKNIEGEYVGYSYKNDNNPENSGYNEISGENGSIAKVTYDKENILSIIVDVFKGQKKWIGKMQMDSEFMGHIPWEYIEISGVSVPQNKFINGLKKCTIFKNDNSTMIHLIEVGNEKYGREIFKKIK